MKILVATSDVPFVEGGHRMIARALTQALCDAGHEAEILTTPNNRFGRQFAAYVATRLTDVELTGNGERVDRLISLRFPSYVLKHPNHVCWLNHRMREYYDLWDSWNNKLSWKGRLKEKTRRTLIHKADHHYLTSNLRKLFAQSKGIQQGLLKWGNIPSEVLYPPPPPTRKYFTKDYGDFILSPSRLTPLKRIALLIEALAHTKVGRAVIVGDGPDRERLQNLIKHHSLEDRVEMLGHADETEILRLYAECRAVFYAPYQEDFGLVTLEAFQSRKPVLTAIDSGGPAELVEHNVSGFLCEPEPKFFAMEIEKLFDDPSLAERLGSSAYEFSKQITWPNTIEKLLS
jgi:glycosyltransferase involved in cell wall biosynthesis